MIAVTIAVGDQYERLAEAAADSCQRYTGLDVHIIRETPGESQPARYKLQLLRLFPGETDPVLRRRHAVLAAVGCPRAGGLSRVCGRARHAVRGTRRRLQALRYRSAEICQQWDLDRERTTRRGIRPGRPDLPRPGLPHGLPLRTDRTQRGDPAAERARRVPRSPLQRHLRPGLQDARRSRGCPQGGRQAGR